MFSLVWHTTLWSGSDRFDRLDVPLVVDEGLGKGRDCGRFNADFTI
jgi:hypothetical protein